MARRKEALERSVRTKYMIVLFLIFVLVLVLLLSLSLSRLKSLTPDADKREHADAAVLDLGLLQPLEGPIKPMIRHPFIHPSIRTRL